MRGKLITFEGCEGCGKSTQSRLLKEYLERKEIAYVAAREPGGTAISEKIRSLILDKENASMTARAEALLYAAARAQILDEVVKPALEEGKIVILDRYVDSSFAYQAYARGLGYDFVAAANSYALESFMPDVTIFMNVPPENSFRRKGGADEADRLELEGLSFHEKVYDGYLTLLKKFPERIIPFGATGSKYDTHKEIVSYLTKKGFIR